MSSLSLPSTNNNTKTDWTKTVPKNITTTASAAEAALTKDASKSNMGQKDFLTLFTTQLKNQDPLDPVKNEAFVAQLAQFSQLEATTGMAQSLTDFVSSQSNQQMLGGANLIGKKVSVPDGPAMLTKGQPVQGVINLPTGADGITINIFDDKGMQVGSQILGAQKLGDMTWLWDGTDDARSALPDGTYHFKATVNSQGKITNPTVSTLAAIQAVSQAPDKTMLLQVEGGQTIRLADVNRIGG